jgi:hypothetical protein
MEDQRPGLERLDAFRPPFTADVEAFIRRLNAEPWVMEPQFLGPEVSRFLDDEIMAGRVQGLAADEDLTPQTRDQYEEVFAAIYRRAEAWLQEKALPVEQALAAEGHLVIDEAPEVPQEPRSLTERVQTVMQQLAEFGRGRDEAEHDQELGR